MRKALFRISAIVFVIILCIGLMPPDCVSKTTFITIGTAGTTGVYYPAGGAIARIVNKKRKAYKIRCSVESTSGSLYNINAVMAGDFTFAIVQSDSQYQAVNGLKHWQDKGPQSDLRAVFSLHAEAVTLCATVDSGIRDIRDLKGKRVNIGNHGSGHRCNSIDALSAVGIDYKTDIFAESMKASEAPGLLHDRRVDAFFYTVGHPSDIFKEAARGKLEMRFVTISGIESLLERYPYYVRTVIPTSLYPRSDSNADIEIYSKCATSALLI
jgi:TRAP transporter TAXI family solute receptor